MNQEKTESRNKLRGKVALITGGNSGMGLATAHKFISEGAQVVITGRREKVVEKAVKELGENATGIVGDVSNLSDLDDLFGQIKSKFGKLDVIFANAGIAEMRHINDVDEAHYDKIMNINLKGLYFTIQKALPLISDGASIILNSAGAHRKGSENFSVYSAAKAGVRSLSRCFAVDLKSRNIRVNTLSPGPIDTPIMGKLGLAPETIEYMISEMLPTMVPLGRMGESEDIANGALFLASRDSKFITGIDLPIDGGFTQI
jgi:NAD(P)-dependent dehydrogenase (short-subunit alcohol dehydrogenase family)